MDPIRYVEAPVVLWAAEVDLLAGVLDVLWAGVEVHVGADGVGGHKVLEVQVDGVDHLDEAVGLGVVGHAGATIAA